MFQELREIFVFSALSKTTRREHLCLTNEKKNTNRNEPQLYKMMSQQASFQERNQLWEQLPSTYFECACVCVDLCSSYFSCAIPGSLRDDRIVE